MAKNNDEVPVPTPQDPMKEATEPTGPSVVQPESNEPVPTPSVNESFARLVDVLEANRPNEGAKGLKRFAERMGAVRTIVTSFFALILLVLILATIFLEFRRSAVLIETFEVPHSLEQEGYSSHVVASQLADQISLLNERAKTRAKAFNFAPSFYETMPDVEVPEAKVSLKTVVAYIKQMFGYSPTRINGDIIVHDNQLYLTVRIIDGNNLTRIQSQTFNGGPENLRDILSQSAQYILRQNDPYILASYFYEEGNTREALALAQYCTYHEPRSDDYWAYVLWGLIAEENGKFEEAIAQYEKAIRIDRVSALAYVDWGLALEKKGDYQGALAKYREAIAADSKAALAYNNWGSILLEQNQDDEAIAKFQKSIELDPELTLPYKNLARALLKNQKKKEAVQKYETALAINPKAADVFVAWGDLLQDEGDYEGAIERFKKAIDIYPNYSLAYNDWGWALIRQERFEEAVDKLHKAIEIAPQFSIANMNLGYALEKLGKYSEAVDEYRRAADNNPHYGLAYRSWGYALMMSGRYKEALPEFEKAVELEARPSAAYNNWGVALQHLGDYQGAIEKYQKAVELDSQFSLAYSNLGHLFEKQKRYQEAMQTYGKLIQSQPEKEMETDARASISRLERRLSKFRPS
ncbi:MAG TPA: tetratricopeptide repeat protein [Pyrinomonadaceae bacterium]|jgi:tetratricopeptide (TPR) repeat protein